MCKAGEPNLSAIFSRHVLDHAPFAALCTGGARPHRITHPYPNLPVHGREGPPSFPPSSFPQSASVDRN
jgi:hypothetical protein